MAEVTKPIKVAIIGGGCASMSAAFELSRPEHQGQFEVTVYQYGWRLGGKGASGRGPNGRIEEHGLHLWLGYYDNAFQIMRETYGELGRDPRTCPIADWRDAFVPDPYVGLMDYGEDGVWRRFMASFPTNEDLPGDPPSERTPTTVSDYLIQSIRLVGELIAAAHEADSNAGADQAIPNAGEDIWSALERLVAYGRFASLTAVIQAVATLELAAVVVTGRTSELVIRLLDQIDASAKRLLAPLLTRNAEVRLLSEILEIVFAQIRGTLRFGLLWDPRGFDAVNDYDSREWLKENGASDQALNSAFVRGLYDLAFAYDDGNVGKPATAAGQGLRGALRMFFGYRGAPFWKMQAGMGDIVFAPMYEVMRNRGVKFAFFHRLENVGLAPRNRLAPGEKPYVTSLDFSVQADVLAGRYEYDPLVDVKGLPCWPSWPDWSQLRGGEQLRDDHMRFESFAERRRARSERLELGEDFDCVVLGVGLGAVPIVAGELVEQDPRWRAMVDNVKTIPTQAFQLWLNENLHELGWEDEPPNLSAYVEPFDTWADMTHLNMVEAWPDAPRTIAYFCSVLSCEDFPDRYWEDPGFEAEMQAKVRDDAKHFLQDHLPVLWPRVADQHGFRWETLKQGDEPVADAFDSQFWLANINPSDRYVLALPGTMQHRISPLDNSYSNLTIAGDWTDCGYNYGCVEAAVMSGRLAAHALSQSPALEDIHGYDHP